MVATFAQMDQAAETVSAIIAAKIIPCALEFLDRTTIHCVEAFAKIGLPLDCEALLLMETDGHPAAVEDEAAKMVELARKKCVQLVRVTKGSIRRYFARVVPCNKYEIALTIGKAIPALSHQIPPVRKIWMSEDPRQSLYDAAALGLAYYAGADVSAAGAVVKSVEWS